MSTKPISFAADKKTWERLERLKGFGLSRSAVIRLAIAVLARQYGIEPEDAMPGRRAVE